VDPRCILPTEEAWVSEKQQKQRADKMDMQGKIERVSEKYLSFAENHYVNAIVGLLLIFTVSEEIIESWKSGISNFEMQAEHGLFFLYLNLFLISTARICKAYVHHRKARRTNSGEIN
jgi:hypothetical protein